MSPLPLHGRMDGVWDEHGCHLVPLFFLWFLVILWVTPYLFLFILCFLCSRLQICRRHSCFSSVFGFSWYGNLRKMEERRGGRGKCMFSICCDSVRKIFWGHLQVSRLDMDLCRLGISCDGTHPQPPIFSPLPCPLRLGR